MEKSCELHLMGTKILLTVDHDQADVLLAEMSKRLRDYERRFSANDDSSELMIVTHNAGIKPTVVDPELYSLIKIGKKISLDPNNNLNIAIGPLVQTWRIGFDDAKVPSDSEIQTVMKKTDPQKIILNDKLHTVFLEEKGMAIDLGSLAKGYFADLLADYVRSQGAKSALINLGGNVVVVGPKEIHSDGLWRVGIQDPKEKLGNYIGIIKVKDKSVVTSGIYQRSLTKDHKKYHHILNTNTGYPLQTNITSLTIVSDKSLDGEIYTTELFGKTTEEIIENLTKIKDIEGIVIDNEDRVFYTEGLKNIISLI